MLLVLPHATLDALAVPSKYTCHVVAGAFKALASVKIAASSGPRVSLLFDAFLQFTQINLLCTGYREGALAHLLAASGEAGSYELH